MRTSIHVRLFNALTFHSPFTISNLNDTPESVRALKDELAHLKQQYDELFHEKELAGRRYQEHYRKWRNFKKWLANEQAAQSSDPTNQFSTPSTARLHKMQRILHRPLPDSDNENDDLRKSLNSRIPWIELSLLLGSTLRAHHDDTSSLSDPQQYTATTFTRRTAL